MPSVDVLKLGVAPPPPPLTSRLRHPFKHPLPLPSPVALLSISPRLLTLYVDLRWQSDSHTSEHRVIVRAKRSLYFDLRAFSIMSLCLAITSVSLAITAHVWSIIIKFGIKIFITKAKRRVCKDCFWRSFCGSLKNPIIFWTLFFNTTEIVETIQFIVTSSL